MNYRDWLHQAKQQLIMSESAKRDAEILLSHVTKKDLAYIIAFDETLLTLEQEQVLMPLLSRRQCGEPVAYLTGQREFWSLPFIVSPATLIPRPDTECLVESALDCLSVQASPSILDLGTGTGAIALAIASELKQGEVIGVDIITDAIALAKKNAKQLSLEHVQFLLGDWFTPVKGKKFDMIVSNPPYIDENDPHLLQGDVRYEPRSALVSADQGLAAIKTIIQQAASYLKPNAWLLIEHGWQQADVVRYLFFQAGFMDVATRQDYGENDRVTMGRWLSFPE